MAVIAFWMTFEAVDATFATACGVSFPSRTPSTSARNPTDFRFAHRTLEPVATPFFH